MHMSELCKLSDNDESSKYLDYTKILLEFLFIISLNNKDPETQNNMKELFKESDGNNLPILTWKVTVTEAVSNLSIALLNIKALGPFSDPSLNPFEGLPIRKEYILQILYDAYNNTDDTNKYYDIRETEIYKDFFYPWIYLFHLIEPTKISDISSSIEIIIEYIRCNFIYI